MSQVETQPLAAIYEGTAVHFTSLNNMKAFVNNECLILNLSVTVRVIEGMLLWQRVWWNYTSVLTKTTAFIHCYSQNHIKIT